MSIPPTKKRKVDAAASGAKLTQSITVKASTRSALSKRQAAKPPAPEPQSPVDDAPDNASDDDDDDDEDDASDNASADDNDGDISVNDSSSDLASSDDDLPTAASKKRKRTDPSAFATSMSKILASHLTATARKDPVLVRAKQAAAHIDDQQLEAKARRLLTSQKREALDRGRVRDIVPRDDPTGDAVKTVMEREKALRKVAQRGVIKLFNAVRAAQVKGEEAARTNQLKGTLGIDRRGKNVTEISKESFLDMISKSKEKS